MYSILLLKYFSIFSENGFYALIFAKSKPEYRKWFCNYEIWCNKAKGLPIQPT